MTEPRTVDCPGADLLLLLAHRLLEDEEQRSVASHCEGCRACKAQRASLGEALEPPAVVDPPPEIFEALRERIAEDQARQRALPDGAQVRLLCTYCKDDLPAPDTIYCASCVAAYHEDCFYEHGRCAAPGCEGTRIVRSAEMPMRSRDAKAQGRGGGRGALLIALGVVFGGGAVAALVPGGDDAQAALAPDAPATPDLGTAFAARPDVVRPKREGPEALDMQDLVSSPDAGQDDEAWKEEYKRILSGRTVTLNFPETPLSEVIGFIQDITGLNIVLSSKVDAEETLVSVRVRDLQLEDALAVILEQANLSAALENEALVIGPRRIETPEERLATIARRGVGSPEWALAIRRRLDAQKISLNFDETPLGEALDFMRDITGLNIVVKDPSVLEVATVSLRLRAISLRNAMDLTLKDHGLGTKLANGVLWIVPRGEATESSERAQQKRDLLNTRYAGEALRDARLTDLATLLDLGLGDRVHVVLSDAAERSKARLILPAGDLTVKDTLDLLRAEAYVTYTIAWLPEGDAVIVLDSEGQGLLADAEASAREELPGARRPALLTAWAEGTERVQRALAAVNALASGEPTLAALKEAVETLRIERQKLAQLGEVSAALSSATDSEAYAASHAALIQAILASQLKGEELRAAQLANDAKAREAQQALAANGQELQVKLEAYNATQREALSKRAALEEALAAVSAADAGPEAQRRLEEARRASARSEGASLEQGRALDAERRRLQQRKESLSKALARVYRESALKIARLESERALLRTAMQDAVTEAIVVEALRGVDAVLKAGGQHRAVEAYADWQLSARAKANEAFGTSMAAYGDVGATFSVSVDGLSAKVDRVQRGSAAAQAGVKVGDTVNLKSTPDDPGGSDD